MSEINMTTRVLAFFCAICPFCIAARRWPDSSFAKALIKIEKSCPACRAYAVLRKDLRSAIYEHQDTV